MSTDMKNIKTFNDFTLNEGVSSILYHFTNIDATSKILKENQFYLSTVIGMRSEIELNRGKYYYMSTQRSKGFSGYAKSKQGGVCFVLDGDKLQNKYKGFAIDYWKWSMDRKDWNSEYDYIQALQSKELEDRIVSDTPFIANAISYIKEIHMTVDIIAENHIKVKEIIEICKDSGIQLYLYNRKNIIDYKSLNKAKSIEPSTIKFKDVDDSYSYDNKSSVGEDALKSLAPTIIVGDEKNRDIIFNKIDLYFEDKEQVISIKTEINRLVKSFRYEAYDLKLIGLNRLKEYKNQKNEIVVFLISLIIKDLKKYNLKSYEEYVDFKEKMK